MKGCEDDAFEEAGVSWNLETAAFHHSNFVDIAGFWLDRKGWREAGPMGHRIDFFSLRIRLLYRVFPPYQIMLQNSNQSYPILNSLSGFETKTKVSFK